MRVLYIYISLSLSLSLYIRHTYIHIYVEKGTGRERERETFPTALASVAFLRSYRNSFSMFWGTDRFPVLCRRKKAEETYVTKGWEGWEKKILRRLKPNGNGVFTSNSHSLGFSRSTGMHKCRQHA